jgi:MFS family permease
MKKARMATYGINLLDHFDSSLYGFLVPILAPLFFPNHHAMKTLIYGYAVMIMGWVTRPLGAWYFSKKADRVGPQKVLNTTIIGMTFTTAFFTCLQPGTAWGVIGLCVLRGLQNFFSAGETSIAGLYILEHAEVKQQHKISSFYLSSTMMGILFASGVTSLLLYRDQPQLYWKWPFYAAGFLGLMGWWLRQTSVSTFIKKSVVSSKMDWGSMIRLMPITGLNYMLYAAPFVLFNSFAADVTSVSIQTLMSLNTLLMVFDLGLLILMGFLLQHRPAKKLLLICSSGVVFMMPILFGCTPDMGVWGICMIRIIMIILGVGFCIPLQTWLSTLPTRNRYATIAMGNALGSEILGRSLPAVGLFLWQITGCATAPGIYIALVAMCAWVSIYKNRN